MKTSLSIIIPTLNEEAYLPGLLDALRRQTLTPLEIIIADGLIRPNGGNRAHGGLPRSI